MVRVSAIRMLRGSQGISFSSCPKNRLRSQAVCWEQDDSSCRDRSGEGPQRHWDYRRDTKVAPLCHKQGQTVLSRGGPLDSPSPLCSLMPRQMDHSSQSSKTACAEDGTKPRAAPGILHNPLSKASPKRSTASPLGPGSGGQTCRGAVGGCEAQGGPLDPRHSVAALSWSPGSMETASQAPVPQCSKKSGSCNVTESL